MGKEPAGITFLKTVSHSKLLQYFKQDCQLSCYPGRCVMCLGSGGSPPAWSTKYKHSAIPDRERLWLCVCVCVCLHACVFAHASVFWSAPCLLLFFVVIREIPLCFLSPTMHWCFYQVGQEVEQCWDVKPLHTVHSPLSTILSLFCVYLPSFHSLVLL